MNNSEEIVLKPRHRPTETVSIPIPVDTLESLKKVAESRDMSLTALLKFYIGHNLRQDLTKLFNDRLLENTALVLSQYFDSEEEIEAIVREIRSKTARTIS